MGMNSILQQDIQQLANDLPFAMELRGSYIAITGATGLLGSIMVYSLLEINRKQKLGLHVIVVIRNKERAQKMFGSEVDYYEYDFSSKRPFELPNNINYLIHFASPTASRAFVEQPVETIQTVLIGTEAILQWAIHTPSLKAMIDVSTLEIYGVVENEALILTEEYQGYIDLMQVRSSYPIAKRTAECLCYAYSQEYKIPVRIARLAQTFGAGVSAEDGRVFAHFARSVLKKEDIILHTDGKLCRSYCYTTDAVNGILRIMLYGENGQAYNVANENTYISIREMAETVCREFMPTKQVVVSPQHGMGYSPQTYLRLSSAKLRHLCWEPRYGLIEMFQRLIASMKEDLYG